MKKFILIIVLAMMIMIGVAGCNGDVDVVYTNPNDGTTLVLDFSDGDVTVNAAYTYYDENGNKIVLEILDGEISARGEFAYIDHETGMINTIYIELEDGVVNANGTITYIVNQATGETITINLGDEAVIEDVEEVGVF